MNLQRAADWITLSHEMKNAKDLVELGQLRKKVLDYHKQKKQDSFELLALYVEREHDMTPNPDEQ